MSDQRPLRIALAQQNFLVGDIHGNTDLILEVACAARDEHHADLVAFPELAVTGYPPEDLLLRDSLATRVEAALGRIAAASRELGIAIVTGYPRRRGDALFNAAGIFADGALQLEYAKQHLPNYQVFDEKRYFTHGDAAGVFSFRGRRIALSVCEDIWNPGPVARSAEAGADLVLNLNASPFHTGKIAERHAVVRERVTEAGIPVIYLNMVGGQDELVFDGGSFVIDAAGQVALQAPQFESGVFVCEADGSGGLTSTVQSTPPGELESVYRALVLGVRDYVGKNGFPGVVLGLSGGIDSALTLAVAADALGPERVEAVMMPFRYTSDMSQEDAAGEAEALGVAYRVISIEPVYEAFMSQLGDALGGGGPDTTEQNLQARCRGVILMALSNRRGSLVLTTGNKSEMAVGYATLYGDMAGGFDVLKDVPKTLVYRLSEYRNSLSPVIPRRVIERPPSAELAPDQQDTDSLPPYDLLDQLLELYIERDQSAEAIIARGFHRDTVYRVVRMVDVNEYKRRQAPVGVRITRRGFGRDRRYPITNGWRIGE